MQNIDLQNEVKRLSNLKQNKNKSRTEIEKQAKINLQKKQVDIASRFEKLENKRLGKQLLEDYLSHYDFSNFSLLNTLADLVFEEVLKTNLQQKITKLNKEGKYPSDKLVKSLHDVEERVLRLKTQLGIDKEEQQDELTKLQTLQKKFEVYIPFHRNEFTITCGHCGKLLLLRKRVKDFESLKHPFFSGRFYYNRRAMELVKKGIWTKEQYAFVFHTSPDYVDWCIVHENDIINIEGVERERIKEFVQNNPHLKDVVVPSEILTNKISRGTDNGKT